jgi:hypothetical protein
VRTSRRHRSPCAEGTALNRGEAPGIEAPGIEAPGIDLAEEAQLALAEQLLPALAQLAREPRYVAATSLHGPADAVVSRLMLGHLRPARMLEVGSGYSTALALAEAAANPELSELEMTWIEPCPERLPGLMAAGAQRLNLLRQPVQEVAPAAIGRLEPRDILCIDSSLVVDGGSDVVWLLLHVLPRLARGVVVRVQNVFWPFEYPAHLLHAFLSGNDSWEILFFPSWIWRCHPELVPPQLAHEEPGAIWLRKVR